MDVMGSVVRRSVTLEVRWILPGRLPAAMVERLGPFSEGIEEREDFYLTDPTLADLSVKIRGGVYLDAKEFRHSPGHLVLPGGASGRLEVWEKWSFPFGSDQRPSRRSAAWKRVGKVRRRRSFAVADDRLVERALAQAASPGCSVELTEVTLDRADWWTLGLEAVGPLDALQPQLKTTAMTIVGDRLPAGLQLDHGASMSYSYWLRTRHDRS